nr:DUF3016 domain-containing protein [uncultured Massilia sp.]
MLLASLLLAPGLASAAVTVNFVAPERFTDLPRAPELRQQALDDIADHFRRLGEGLAPHMDLVVDVLDIDLAGRERPGTPSFDSLRIMDGIGDRPRMHLRYLLTDDGKEVARGEAELSDSGYRERISTYPGAENLRYEKQMIDDWWRKTLPRQGR